MEQVTSRSLSDDYHWSGRLSGLVPATRELARVDAPVIHHEGLPQMDSPEGQGSVFDELTFYTDPTRKGRGELAASFLAGFLSCRLKYFKAAVVNTYGGVLTATYGIAYIWAIMQPRKPAGSWAKKKS